MDKLEFERETVDISGGRTLYNYRFFEEGKLVPAPEPEPKPDEPEE